MRNRIFASTLITLAGIVLGVVVISYLSAAASNDCPTMHTISRFPDEYKALAEKSVKVCANSEEKRRAAHEKTKAAAEKLFALVSDRKSAATTILAAVAAYYGAYNNEVAAHSDLGAANWQVNMANAQLFQQGRMLEPIEQKAFNDWRIFADKTDVAPINKDLIEEANNLAEQREKAEESLPLGKPIDRKR